MPGKSMELCILILEVIDDTGLYGKSWKLWNVDWFE